MKSRKRHILVEALGLLLAVPVHPDSVQDRDGAKTLLENRKRAFPRLKKQWADAAYAGEFAVWVEKHLASCLEVMKNRIVS